MKHIDIEKRKMRKYFRKHNLSLYKILNSVFNNKIKKISYLGNNLLRKMPEYKFNLLKFNVVLEDFSNYTVYIKAINKNKIQESLFCYWFVCEEDYSFNTKFSFPRATIVNCKSQDYERKYELKLLSKNNKKWKSTFVEIIDLQKYINKNFNNNVNIQKYLFIGII